VALNIRDFGVLMIAERSFARRNRYQDTRM
jgi:hypothetical protein